MELCLRKCEIVKKIGICIYVMRKKMFGVFVMLKKMYWIIYWTFCKWPLCDFDYRNITLK